MDIRKGERELWERKLCLIIPRQQDSFLRKRWPILRPQGGSVSPISFVKIPVSILIGSFIGLAAGWGLAVYFKRVHIRDTVKVIILLCVSFILVTLEDRYSDIVPFSSLISVMGIGIALQKKREEAARRLSVKFNKVWVCAEIMLFVLVVLPLLQVSVSPDSERSVLWFLPELVLPVLTLLD